MPPPPALLLETARVHPSPATVLRAANQIDDWDALLDHAHRHGLTPLLYRWLRHVRPDAVPPLVMQDLRARFNANATLSLQLSAELVRLVTAFEAAGLELLPWDGPAIAWYLYETPALRQTNGLGLLARSRDLPRAMETLLACGYHREPPRTLFGLRRDLQLRNGAAHLTLRRAPESLWNRRKEVLVNGRPIPTPGPDDLLDLLTAQAAKNNWTRLADAGEIARLLTIAPIDLTRLPKSHPALRLL